MNIFEKFSSLELCNGIVNFPSSGTHHNFLLQYFSQRRILKVFFNAFFSELMDHLQQAHSNECETNSQFNDSSPRSMDEEVNKMFPSVLAVAFGLSNFLIKSNIFLLTCIYKSRQGPFALQISLLRHWYTFSSESGLTCSVLDQDSQILHPQPESVIVYGAHAQRRELW